MKKYNIKFSYSCDGEIEIYAESKEEAVEEFKYKSFMEVIDASDAWCDADEMNIDDVYEVQDND